MIDVKKVVLGISGGVDSSVAAVLLKNQGFEVIGVTFIFTDDFDTKDAEIVCNKLGIQHIIKDYRIEFKKEIIDQFISDYKSGLTPNPCVLCNKKIKIKYLYDTMEECGADYIATGHYARLINNKLYKSKNINKDQSYFLSQINKKQLERIIFPLDNLDKEEVRKIAKDNDLINANKKDSFDVCFITSDFSNYINDIVGVNEGKIIDYNTNLEIGKHKGLSHYTIGQRKGLNLGGNQERLFVVDKDIEKNILYVASGQEDSYLYSNAAIIANVNWITDDRPKQCVAKFRYRQSDNEVILEYLNNGDVFVKYPYGIKAVTPGQVCVFYDNEECLGGGIIKEVIRN